MRIRPLEMLSVMLIAALLAGCASAPRATAFVPPKIGATWSNAVQSSGSFGSGPSEVSGRMGERDWEGRKLLAFESDAGTLLTLPSGHWVAQLNPQGRPAVSWDPPIGLDWPVEVGKVHTYKGVFKLHAQNRLIPFEERQVVEAYEDVTVPAGTFKAFRIRTTSSMGNDALLWYAPEVGFFIKQVATRTERNANGAGTRTSELKRLSAP